MGFFSTVVSRLNHNCSHGRVLSTGKKRIGNQAGVDHEWTLTVLFKICLREMKKRDSGLLGFLTLCHIRRKRERENRQ